MEKEFTEAQNAVNKLPAEVKGKISDGFHSFDELYNHRIALFIALCRQFVRKYPVWKSKNHSDGSVWDGWFVLGLDTMKGKQITYHLPISEWDKCNFAMSLSEAPPFDGHTSCDVLERLAKL